MMEEEEEDEEERYRSRGKGLLDPPYPDLNTQ
jgi:hypothetical protein